MSESDKYDDPSLKAGVKADHTEDKASATDLQSEVETDCAHQGLPSVAMRNRVFPVHSSKENDMSSLKEDQFLSGACDSITIPKEEYMNMTGIINSQNAKIQASQNLHLIIDEKDQDLEAEREKSKSLEETLKVTESKMANIMKQQLASVTFSSQEFASFPSETKSGLDQCDGGSTLNQDPNEQQSELISLRGRGGVENLESIQASITPGISKSMFDNVVKENIKMKKTLHEILDKEGENVKTFMEKKEYEAIIIKYQQDLAVKRQEVENLQSLLNSTENTKRLFEYQTKVSRLEKNASLKQGLVDSLTRECDREKEKNKKLEQEYLALKKKLTALSQGTSQEKVTASSSEEQDKQEGKGENSALEQQLNEERQKHHTLQQEYVTLYTYFQQLQLQLQEQNAYNQQLQQACQDYGEQIKILTQQTMNQKDKEVSEEEIDAIKKEHEMEMAALRQEIDKKVQEVELLNTQLVMYTEDFQAEKDEKQILIQKYEQRTSQQQLHIRQLNAENEKLKIYVQQQKQHIAGIRSGKHYGSLTHVSSRESMEVSSQMFECPRCMREFDNEKYYDEHVQKCTAS